MKKILNFWRRLDGWLVRSARKMMGCTQPCGWCGAKWDEPCKKGCL